MSNVFSLDEKDLSFNNACVLRAKIMVHAEMLNHSIEHYIKRYDAAIAEGDDWLKKHSDYRFDAAVESARDFHRVFVSLLKREDRDEFDKLLLGEKDKGWKLKKTRG